jgi:isoleucyl-tRNA synthetase
MEDNKKVNKSINERELEILEFWNKEKIFEKTLLENKGNPTFTFYDGPPFATGMPHHGHLMQSYLKDSIPRYQTMQGKYVRRVWGWDTHGLPIENLIEKEMGFKSKAEIEAYGVGKFTKAATDSVLRYEDEWKKIIPRIGRWVDMDNRYMTLTNTFTESCWWAFSELYKKSLVYEGYKVMHVCPRCETPLASSEVALGYQDIKDISVYVKFQLKEEENTFLLAWTTTPWTLPGNTAIVVHKDLDYVKVDAGQHGNLILAKSLVEKVLSGLEYKVLEEMKGESLVGKTYEPVFEYYKNNLDKLVATGGKEVVKENIWKVWHADFVRDTDGTGIAHEAPAFGEDDYNLAQANDIPTIIHVGLDGRFKPEVTDFSGERVKWKGETQATDKKVCEFLSGGVNNDGTHDLAKSKILKTEVITHSYPLCWRCDTPLLNYATTSWFVAVSKMRSKLVEENSKVYWVPENVRLGRMGQWLEGARDWALSRNRYWGAPLPVWKSKDGNVFVPGSLKELQTKTKANNNFILVRHGETDANKKNEIANSIASGTIDVVLGSDFSLNENGVKQAEKAAEELKETKIDLVVASPYKRTKETAEIIAKTLGISPEQIVFDDRLKEWQVGETNNGKTWTEFYEENPGVNYFHYKMKGAEETKTDVQNRMSLVLKDLDEKYSGKNILLVTHKSPISCIIFRNQGNILDASTGNFPTVWYNSKNCELIKLDYKPLPTDEVGQVNFHLPHIDDLKVYDVNGEVMKREGGVFDCWYESGSMPYAQFHYPFENKELFEKNFPADFIAEAQDQTRGWFYTMLVLGVALFDKSPFKSVITSGLIMAGDGKKMSKSLKNYTDPIELVSKFGSDAVRYYILSTPVVKGEAIRFTDLGVSQVYSKNISRLLNVLSFYKMTATENVLGDSESDNVMDKYIVSRFRELKRDVQKGFDELFVDQAFRPFEKYIDDLSVWYLRRSRERLKSDDQKVKNQALNTLKFILQSTAKVLAPVMPYTAEMIWQEVRNHGDQLSVHLAAWPSGEDFESDDAENISKMDLAREVVSSILDERIKAGIKVRQPLLSATFNTVKYEQIKTDLNLISEILDETNIREIIFKESNDSQKICELNTEITEELKMEGVFRELVRNVQDARKAASLKVEDRVDLVLPETMGEFERKVLELKKEALKKECGIKEISFGSELKVVV